jgi:hypothetical protein
LVALKPEIALEGFKIGNLEVLGHEVVDVGAELFPRAPVFWWEGFPVLCEGCGVPLCG